MNSDLVWEKEFFENSYYLYSNGLKIGNLIQNTLGRKASATINNKNLQFKASGIFRLMTLIYDNEDNVIGSIKFNFFNSTAKVILHKKEFCLKNYNFWTSKWELNSNCGKTLKIQGNSSKGIIESELSNGDLILCGLYIANQFWQTRIGIWAAVLIPLWINYLILI